MKKMLMGLVLLCLVACDNDDEKEKAFSHYISALETINGLEIMSKLKFDNIPTKALNNQDVKQSSSYISQIIDLNYKDFFTNYFSQSIQSKMNLRLKGDIVLQD